MSGGSKTPRYGFDFSRNIGTNLEVHGEFAFIRNFTKPLVDANGNTTSITYDAVNYVLGTRYLSTLNTTYIFEYYHQGTGYSTEEMSDFLSFIDKGYNAFLSSGDTQALTKARTVTQQGGYGRFTPETDYLYLRVSQPEPFDILYFTPSLTWIYNLSDRSFTITPELLYTPITNLELRLGTGFLVGTSRQRIRRKAERLPDRAESEILFLIDHAFPRQIRNQLRFIGDTLMLATEMEGFLGPPRHLTFCLTATQISIKRLLN